MTIPAIIHWGEANEPRSAQWRSQIHLPPPSRVQVVDDTLSADKAYHLACEGTSLLWRSDFQNARQLLVAMMHRVDRKPKKAATQGKNKNPQAEATVTAAATFHLHRQARAQRARILASLLVPLDGDFAIALPRAPDVREALAEAWGSATGTPSIVSLRELLGLVGAHEWRKKGVEIPALGTAPNNRIHPHYGVFSPTRGEYIDLIARTALPATDLAFEIGVGTGVLSAVLARRGVRRVVATDTDPRALACARDNLTRLGLLGQVEVIEHDMFPDGRAPLIVCNPPWVPAKPGAPIERAIYDEGSQMLREFLAGLAAHLTPNGEGWLVLSDLAEHLGLRSREQLLAWISESGLVVLGRHGVRPRHGKVLDDSDALHAARAAEVTSLWRLGAR